MKVTVLGAGALGTMVGGLIQRFHPEIDVLLIARGQHARQMQSTGGALLLGSWGRWHVPVAVSSDVKDVAGSDCVLVAVKSQHTESVMSAAERHLGEAIVLSLQNGISQRTLSRFVRADRLLVGMTAANIAMVAPGEVSLQRRGATVLGGVSPAVPASRVAAVAQLLNSSTMRAGSSPEILGVQYNKILMNTVGYASVLSGADFIREAVLDRRWRAAIGLPILAEGLNVLRRAGVALGRTAGISDVLRFRRLLMLLNLRPLETAVRFAVAAARSHPIIYSVFQDLLRGRTTEIEYVNGEIVRLADAVGIEAPYNAEVVRGIQELECRGDGSFYTQDQMIARFESLPGGPRTPSRWAAPSTVRVTSAECLETPRD